MSRSSAARTGPHLQEILPCILESLALEDDELVEYCLQVCHSNPVEKLNIKALESFILKCPLQMTAYLEPIVQKALECLKHDPNYHEDESEDGMEVDPEDAEMDEDEEDEDDEAYALLVRSLCDRDYSDDDDMSWKIRKAAAKLLSSLFATRTEYIVEFYSITASTLVSRFKERVESVRVEIITAFSVLVRQTGIVSEPKKRIVRKPSNLAQGPDQKKRKGENGAIVSAQSFGE